MRTWRGRGSASRRAAALAVGAVLGAVAVVGAAPSVEAVTDPVVDGTVIAPALAGVAVTAAPVREARALLATRDERLARERARAGDLADELDRLHRRRADGEVALVQAVADIDATEARLASAGRAVVKTRSSERAQRRRYQSAQDEVSASVSDGYIRAFGSDPIWTANRDAMLEQDRSRVLVSTVHADKVGRAAAERRRLATAMTARRRAIRHRLETAQALADARTHRSEVAQSIVDTDAALVRTADERDAQEAVVARASRARDVAERGVLDARVLAQVVGADFPLVALDAYWKAAAAAPCPTPWWLLAGVGRTESAHGTEGGSHLDVTGHTDRLILGIALDGTRGTAVVPDTDGGKLDGDTKFDRAVGPMQFIPSTWQGWQSDGNGDGVADPHSLYDAAAAAARYMCAASAELTSDDGMRRGLLSYNRSTTYGSIVIERAKGYQASVEIPPMAPPA